MSQQSVAANMPSRFFLSKFLQKNGKIIVDIVCALFIFLFLYTGTSKFLDFKGFTADMNNQPFPNWMTPYLVWSLPTIEIAISIGLMLNKTRRAALYSAMILMILFTVYTGAVLLHFFPYVPCSCGGVIKLLSWNQHLLFDMFFVILAIIGIVSHKGKRNC
jgi:uncharacterized membrane protein YphA (DoxX/SURF4 family)